MKELQSLTLQNIENVFRTPRSFSSEDKFELSNGDHQEEVGFLEVNDEGILHQYVLVKVSEWDKADPLSSSIVQPQFLIEDKNGEKFGAFEKNHLSKLEPADANNLVQLKVILKNLAKIQAKCCSVNEVNNDHSEYILKDVAQQVTAFSPFKKIQQTKIDFALETLQYAAKKLSKALNLVVQSQWCPNNIYISSDNSNVVFLQTSSGLLLPPSYDAVFLIFSLSNEKFRQYHFEDLIKYYFQALAQALKRENSALEDKITEAYIETQTSVLLPIVKLALIQTIQDQKSEQFKELAANLGKYLEFSHVNQEDIYHVIKAKLSSSDYDLLNYSLERLSETNGHLGDYFHVQIAVRFQNKEENIRLFAKILLASSEAFTELIESGVAERESFFYSTLQDLYIKFGLQDLIEFAPKCYMCGDRGIILDDLSIMGFKTLTPNTVINIDGLEVILDQLAKFHVSSLILEERLSEEAGEVVRFDGQYPGMFNETIFVHTGSMAEWMKNRFNSIFILLEKLPELKNSVGLTDQQIRSRLENIRTGLYKNIESSKSLRNVINHGDMHVGNMLFKIEDDNSVSDGKLIDFQILRYLPPAMESQFFVKLASNKETRDKYQKALQDRYYGNLASHMKRFDLNPEAIYSRKDFDEDLRNTKHSASLLAYFYGCFILSDPKFREEIIQDPDKTNYYLVTHQDEFFDVALQDENFKGRITGILQDLLDCIKTES
ncbi:uncharacterized protein LOC109535826 [Dendroctonus ponderosae]|uniref:uncharacterized protein LOC109535826 n=1 Tax=Dendroctonus ponderosae TaxID=77166 RepID=UPI002036539F|nr:uncharacterized protein LOC109535826 [Dendroctonus ponderosae]